MPAGKPYRVVTARFEVVRLYYRLFGKTPPKQKPALSLFYRGISILLAYAMLISPTLITQTADAATQYANISTLAWGKVGNTITYEYDANGSLTSKVTTGVDAEEVVYIYNLQNRLSQVVRTTPADLDTDEQEDDAIVETTWYYYNDEGIRVESIYLREEVTDIGQGGESRSTTDNTATSFLIDSYNPTGYAQVIEELTDDGTNITATTYTTGDDVISQVKSTWNGSSWTAGGTRYLLSDGQGSTRQLVDSSAAVVDSFSYDGYGMMLGGNPTSAAPAATNLLYTGEQFDTSAQQYYLRARYYDPSNGRFNRMDDFAGNSQDPQSLHKYLYVNCNPINSIDPTGNFEFSISGMLSALSIGITVLSFTLPALNYYVAGGILGATMESEGPSDAYVVALSLGSIFGGGKLGTGLGLESSYELLYIKSQNRWFDYVSIGPSCGLKGTALALESGPVWNIRYESDYLQWYLSTSIGGTIGMKFFNSIFKGLSIGPGIAGTIFWDPTEDPDTHKRSVGFKIGPALGKTGMIYSFTAAYYKYAPRNQATDSIKNFFNRNLRPPESDDPVSAKQFTQKIRNELKVCSTFIV